MMRRNIFVKVSFNLIFLSVSKATIIINYCRSLFFRTVLVVRSHLRKSRTKAALTSLPFESHRRGISVPFHCQIIQLPFFFFFLYSALPMAKTSQSDIDRLAIFPAGYQRLQIKLKLLVWRLIHQKVQHRAATVTMAYSQRSVMWLFDLFFWLTPASSSSSLFESNDMSLSIYKYLYFVGPIVLYNITRIQTH